ncbi:MFS transporter [Gordonia humi]
MFGHRAVIIAGLVLLLIGSGIAALCIGRHWYGGVVAGRVVQGLAGGVFPCAFGYARDMFPPDRLSRIVPVLSAVFGVGGALGMVVAGPLADALDVSALFWVVGALAVVGLLGAAMLPSSGRTTSVGGVDLPGAVLFGGALVALLLAVSQGGAWGWSSSAGLGSFAAAAVCGAAFVIVERRADSPLIDLRILFGRSLAGLNAASIVIGAGMFAAVTLIPLFAQSDGSGYGFGFGPSATGLLIAPMAVCMVLAGPIASRLADRIGARGVFQIGALLAAAGLTLLGVAHTDPIEVAVGGAVLGVSYGLAFGGLGTLVVAASPPDQTGAATGANTVLRTVGGAMGTVMASSILAASAAPPGPATEAGYRWAFITAGVVAGSAALVAVAVPVRR